MTDSSNPHAPSREFKEYLARDLARSLRHEARFAPSQGALLARRLGVVAISAVGTVFVLAIGLALGNSTGYASARVESVQRRNALASHTMDVTSQVASLRLNLARTRDGLNHLVASTPKNKRALAAAEAELAAMEASAARIETDLTQGETAVAPLPVSIPMTRAFSIACTALAMNTSATPPQEGVPIVDLPDPVTKTAAPLGSILGLREVSGGKVLINDWTRRQFKLFDSTLTGATIVFDSVQGTSTSYGNRPLALVKYLGDSSLTTDADAGTLMVLGPTGQITRVLASPFVQSVPPYMNLVTMLRDRYSGVDDRGRILFDGPHALTRQGMTIEERVAGMGKDSTPLMRVDPEGRRVDTLTFTRSGGTTALMGRVDAKSPVRFSRMPVEIVDVWGVLSDGTVGIVRGQDYHIDWILPDGTRRSTAKLPFDWKRMTDEEKQRLIDSVRTQQSAVLGKALAQGAPAVPPPDGGGGGGGGGGGLPGARVYVPPDQRPQGRPPMPMEYIPPALKDIPDYYPSVRISAAIADLDGNLWVLPNSTAQSKKGELVYDVANPRGDFHRVRLPVGYSIVGFGKGGIVYLQSGDRTSGFTLARSRLARGTAPQMTPTKQPSIPVVTLATPSTRSATTITNVPNTGASVVGVHEFADGKVIINDPYHRQLKVFGPNLGIPTVVADSAPGLPNSYGPAPVALIPFKGDSSLFPDLSTQGLLVLDGAGRVARAIALPNSRDFPNVIVGFSGVDPKGRLIYRASIQIIPLTGDPRMAASDSSAILRADLESRRIDTLGRVRVRDGGSQTVDFSNPGVRKVTQIINPVPVLDDWAMLSDGTVAVVRGHDYHVDLIYPDGTTRAG